MFFFFAKTFAARSFFAFVNSFFFFLLFFVLLVDLLLLLLLLFLVFNAKWGVKISGPSSAIEKEVRFAKTSFFIQLAVAREWCYVYCAL